MFSRNYPLLTAQVSFEGGGGGAGSRSELGQAHTEIFIFAAVQRVCDLGFVKKSICLVKIIMSKLHFANLSFDEKSSNTLRENEKYLKFCLINIYFFLHK